MFLLSIQTSLNIRYFQVKELKPGHALIIKKNGTVTEELCKEPTLQTPCSFERIYFSSGTDKDIYLERKKLGELLADKILKAVHYDFENTLFSFIPNTAEVAFYGMVKGLEAKLNEIKNKQILALSQKGELTDEALSKILAQSIRAEKLAVKDEKLRTFIADDASRGEMVSHVYDVTYGIVQNEVDTLVLIDDSIVRGTTLRDSIIYILSTLKPKKIIIVSSAPQIRYPDCYGIDISERKTPDAVSLLAFSGGMPLAAAALAEGGGAAGRKRCVSDIASIPGKAPLRLAGEWESWLKGKDSLAAGFDMNTLVGWMQRWVADLASLRLGGPVGFFPAEHDILHGLAGRMTIDSALGCYNEINQTRRVAQHPLNPRLFLEDMLLRYARAFGRSAAPAVRK